MIIIFFYLLIALVWGTGWLIWKTLQGVCWFFYYAWLAAPYVIAGLLITLAYLAVVLTGSGYLGYLSLTETGRNKIRAEVWPRISSLLGKIPDIMPEKDKPQAFYSNRR